MESCLEDNDLENGSERLQKQCGSEPPAGDPRAVPALGLHMHDLNFRLPGLALDVRYTHLQMAG